MDVAPIRSIRGTWFVYSILASLVPMLLSCRKELYASILEAGKTCLALSCFKWACGFLGPPYGWLFRMDPCRSWLHGLPAEILPS